MTTQQRRVADGLVNVFEYSSTEPRYDMAAALADGRGYTCGKIGFTTDGAEVRDVVEAYVARTPDSPLRTHLPRLRELADGGSGDASGLPGFVQQWADAARDPVFRQVQDTIADRLTYDPALATARRIGLRTPLGVAILLDTTVQHGNGDDPDGMPTLVARASVEAGGEPSTGVPEKAWLEVFLDIRKDVLRDPHDADTRQVWAESVDRVDALRELVDAGEHQLTAPMTVTVAGEDYQLR